MTVAITEANFTRNMSAPPLVPAGPDPASVYIPLSRIVPSKTNPGRTFDPARDTDTMENIRVHGVLQSIILRVPGVKGCSFNVAGKYEIVAGERRYHCAVKAGRISIPATIRELTDVQALELQWIENDQREDLDPMGKAAALRRVWDAYKHEGQDAKTCMARMIERTNRKPRTVWNLLSLGNFIKRGEELLREGKLSMSHAYEICRRPASEQNRILNWYMEEIEYGDGVSVRELKEYIREECDHFIDAAPFDKADAQLVKEAGACTDCQKNTAVNPNLVDLEDEKKKVKAACQDGECYAKKVKANLVQIEKQAEATHGKNMVLRLSTMHAAPKGATPVNQWKEVKEGSCKDTFAAVIVDGDKPGKELFACRATNMCKAHWVGRSPAVHREPSRPRSDDEKKRMLQKQRGKKADQAYRAGATAAFRKAVIELKIEDLREVALQMMHMTDRRHRNPIFAAMGWKTSNSFYGAPIPVKQIEALKPADLAAFLGLMTVASKVLPGLQDYWPETHVALAPFAKRHKVDLVRIEAEATKKLRARWKEIDARKDKTKTAAQTSAKKKKAA